MLHFKPLAAAMLAALISATASAASQPAYDMPRDVDARAYLPQPRSRAEVIADLEIYRRSGLAELDNKESPDAFSGAYAAAQARYQALRASQEFKQLVARIARERGEAQASAGAPPATMAQ